MKIKSKKKINASVDKIWEILRNPNNMTAWNPKCCSCQGANRELTVGYRFEATFELNGKRKNASCEVIDLKPCEKIQIRYSGQAFSSRNGFVDETFYLVIVGVNQTLVKLEVDFTNSGVPLFVKFILWLVSTFGYKSGPSSLGGLQDLILTKEK